MFLQQGNDDQLAEQSAVRRLQQIPRGLELQRARRAKLNADHQPFAAHFLDELVTPDHPFESREQARAFLLGVLHQPFGFDHLERGEAGRHCQIVLRECRAVDHGAIHAIENLVEDPFARQYGAGRHLTAGQRFRQKNHVWLDAPMLAGEEPPGTSQPSLNLVGDKQRAVLSAKLDSRPQIVVGRDAHAFALDRLDDEGGDFFRGERFFQGLEIVERDFGTAGQKRAEAVAEDLVADQRQRAVRQAVESVAAVHDAVATCCRTCKLDRGLDRFGPRIGEKHFLKVGHVA